MAITNKEQGVWILDEVYNKINEGDIWAYTGAGGLYSWGYNSNGRLGLNDQTQRSSPTQVGTAAYEFVASNSNVVAAIKTDGTLWTWGSDNNGQLMHNTLDGHLSSPTQVGTDNNWSTFGWAGDTSSLATKTDGTLWACGRNNYGQLGQNQYNVSSSSPVQIPGTWSTAIGSQQGIAAAVTSGGDLFVWGYAEYGMYGNGQPSNQHRSSPVQLPSSPAWQNSVNNIAYGYSHTLAMKTNGTMWCTGANTYGQLGLGGSALDGGTPAAQSSQISMVQVGTATTWNKIDSAQRNSIGTKTDGTLWTWGRNSFGELGLNDKIGRSSPTQIPGTDWDTPQMFAINSFCTKTDGTLWAWGYNGGGTLGINIGAPESTMSRSSPVQIPGTFWNLEKNQATGYTQTVILQKDL